MGSPFYERFKRDGASVRKATELDVYEFCKNVCEEDLHELEYAFGIPRDKLLDDNLDNRNGLTLGFWILSFHGEDCVLLGVRRDIDVPKGVWVWSQTSDALARHKLSYARWARACLCACIRAAKPDAEEVRTVIWERHRVRGMVNKVLGGTMLGILPKTELGVYRLKGVEEDLATMKGVRNGNQH